MTVIFSIYLIVIALILGMIWVPKNDFYGCMGKHTQDMGIC